jgi:hypothetical protein
MAIELLTELRAIGVVLSIDADGRLAYDGPAGVVGDNLLARMRAKRDGLLAELAPKFLYPMPGVICPCCRSHEYLIEHAEGLRCDQCRRDAFRFEDDVIVRVDHAELIEVDWPVIVQAIESDKRPAKIERERSQTDLVFDS